MATFDVTVFDRQVLDSVSVAASRCERLRMNLDLRNSPDDGSQRMLNALEPGTVLPIHRHRTTSETLIVLRGSVRQNFYAADGSLSGSWILAAGSDSPGINVPAGQWHNTESLESGTVIFEAKDGPYQPITSQDILNK